jgi:hypothetical protein
LGPDLKAGVLEPYPFGVRRIIEDLEYQTEELKVFKIQFLVHFECEISFYFRNWKMILVFSKQ